MNPPCERLLAGFCPYCGRGPFRSPASHTAAAHGVSGHDLREEFGLQRNAVLTSPDYHAERSNLQLRRLSEDPELLAKFREAGLKAVAEGGKASSWDRRASVESHLRDRQRPERKQLFHESIADVDWSMVARHRTPEQIAAQTKRVQEAAARYRIEHPEEWREAHSRLGKALPREHFDEMGRRAVGKRDPEKWLAAVKAGAAKRAKVPRGDYPAIVERARNGETQQSIADGYGVDRTFIGRIVRGQV